MIYSKPIDEHHGIRKKLNVLPPLFKQLEERGFIGKVILDVGSANRSVSDEYFQRQSRLFYPTTGKKIIRVDVGFEKLASEKEGILDLQADIEDNSTDSTIQKKRLLHAARYLGVDPRKKIPQVDTLVFSDVLNYVDYRRSILRMSRFLKIGGRIVIFNQPGHGMGDKFHPKRGLTDNHRLLQLLERMGFSVEHQEPVSYSPSTPLYPTVKPVTPNDRVLIVARRIK